jgi:autotransporter translocation and assembly factor TamB
MSEEKEHKKLKAFKIFIIGLTVFVGVQLLGRFLLNTDWVQEFVKGKIEEIASKQLADNTTLEIGELDGDLWSEMKFIDVDLKSENPVFKADTLYVSYDIWSFLSDVYLIDEFRSSGVQLNVREQQDTVFNVQQLLAEPSVEAPEEASPEPVKFTIGQINVNNFNADIYSPSYLPDSMLVVRQLEALASVTKTDTIGATLSQLAFKLDEGRLPSPVQFSISGSYLNQEITLQQLMIETGKSLLQASGNSNLQDSTIDGGAVTQPFWLAELQPYLERKLPEEDIEMQLSVSGTFSDLNIKLDVDGGGINQLQASLNASLPDGPELRNVTIKGKGVNLRTLTADSLDSYIGPFNLNAEGSISAELEESELIYTLAADDLVFQNYVLEEVRANGSLKENISENNVTLRSPNQEEVRLENRITGVFDEQPMWKVDYILEQVNAANWVDGDGIKTDIWLAGTIEGAGFELNERPITITGNNKSPKFSGSRPLKVAGKELQTVTFNADISEDNARGNLEGEFNTGEFQLKGNAQNLTEQGLDFQYQLSTKRLNIAELTEFEDFPSAINVLIEGSGEGESIDKLVIRSEIQMDTSVINGARFTALDGDISYQDGILTIEDGNLKSDIADGQFKGRKNITDETDPENWLELDLMVKNTQPLAPLLEVDVLQARGTVKGRVTQDTSKILKGDLNLDFENVTYDSLFQSTALRGNAVVELQEQRVFDIDLEIEKPIINGLTFQDIQLKSDGIANADTLSSDFSLEIVGSERGKIIQSGTVDMKFAEQLLDMQLNEFELITTQSQLSLKQPFNARIKGFSMGTDSLVLKDDDGTYLNAVIPYADSTEQHITAEGLNFDFGLMQEVIFGERYLDGVLSGNLDIDRTPDSLNGTGSLDLQRINYNGLEADSLGLQFNVKNDRITANGAFAWDGEEHVIASLDLPFKLKEQSELSDEFFDQPVKGNFEIIPTKLERFKPLLEQFEIFETDGIISFNAAIEGSAGDPQFDGAFKLEKPILSGIEVDTVTAGFKYDNIKNGIEINGAITATNQKAANISAEIPVSFNFRTLELQLPGEEDQISIKAKTDNFNIAVFNDFLDDEFTKKLRGRLDADVVLEGPAGGLSPKGFITLRNARVEVPIAGITLSDISSDLEFTSEGLNLKKLTMESGNGSFDANGTINLQGIYPETVDLNVNANQFKLANTADYNFVIDLESKLQGDATTPKATGMLTVKNGFVFLQDFGENNIEEVQLEGEEFSTFSPYDSLAIEMSFKIERNFYVRNRNYLDMEIEMVGELDAQKETNGELSLFGSLNGEGGYVRPLGKNFTMEESNITFSGPIDDPELFIRSRYLPPTRQKGEVVEIFYIIEGTMDDQEFKFESNPPMEESDIICYTLFGKPCYSLESWQSVFSGGEGTSATDVLTDVLLDEVEALATRELGVDVVQIDNTGANGATSIKTGWYINQRTFFAIINEISGSTPKTLFMLEYVLNESWDLILTQGEGNRQGIDFRYQYDY